MPLLLWLALCMWLNVYFSLHYKNMAIYTHFMTYLHSQASRSLSSIWYGMVWSLTMSTAYMITGECSVCFHLCKTGSRKLYLQEVNLNTTSCCFKSFLSFVEQKLRCFAPYPSFFPILWPGAHQQHKSSLYDSCSIFDDFWSRTIALFEEQTDI